MNQFRDWSIKRKLTIIILSTTVVTLVLALFALASIERFSTKNRMARQLDVFANALSANCAAALLSNNPKAAADALEILRTESHIADACLFDKSGVRFAEYSRSRLSPAIFPNSPSPEGSYWEKGRLGLSKRIMLAGEPIGTLYVHSNAEEMNFSVGNLLPIIAIIMVTSILVALALASRLQRVISNPILHLASTAKRISLEKDYSLRAVKDIGGEIGTMIDGFNSMVYQIEIRDEELRRHRDHLEEEVAARTVELVRVNSELKASKERTEEASRAKSEFLANMSHELRTPLNAIIGYSELLQEEAKDLNQKHVVPDLQKINAAGKHLLGLINDILDLSKIEVGKTKLFIESFEIRQMVDEVVNSVKPIAEKNRSRLSVQYSADLGWMEGDTAKIRQILFNLLSNACKFTENGDIWIDAARHKDSAGEEIVFWIRDTGIGIEPDQLNKIFQPFHQADTSTTRKFGGTGLGLAISQQFCRMMGGKISVESRPCEGSAFTFRLPAIIKATSEGDAAQENHEPSPEIIGIDKNHMILVVDDDPLARDLMKRFLTRQGFGVVASGNGQEALSLAKEWHPIAITLDVLLGDVSGWDILSALKADPEIADIPVIMVSIIDDKNRGFSLGATDYLTKPVHPESLAAIMRRFGVDGAPGSVLIIEDDEPSRKLLRRLLERDGWKIEEAVDAFEGLERVAQSIPSIILLDLMMPGMDGFEFVNRLRAQEQYSSIPIVVLTAMTLTAEEKERLNSRVTMIAHKASTSWTSLMGELTNIVRDKVSRSLPFGAKDGERNQPSI